MANSRLTTPAILLAGLGALATNIWSAYASNASSKRLAELAKETQDEDLKTKLNKESDSAYSQSRAQGTVGQVLFILSAVPNFWNSVAYRPGGINFRALSTYVDHWDYLLGRTCQVVATGLTLDSAFTLGSGNPQNSTAQSLFAGTFLHVGNFFVSRHHYRNLQNGALRQPLNDGADLEAGEGVAPGASAPAAQNRNS